MRFDTITAENWQKFEDTYPGAYAYLLHASLQGEWRALKSLGRPNAWEIERLKELDILYRQE